MSFSVGDRVQWDGDLGTVMRVTRHSVVVKMDDGMVEDEPADVWEPVADSPL